MRSIRQLTRLAGFLLTSLALTSLGAASQEVTQPPGALEGVIARIGTDEPLARVLVELRGPSSAETTTEADGKFYFPNLKAGNYRVLVRRDGFWPGEFGQRWVDGPGQPIPVTPNQRLAARIVMTPAGVIAGRIANRAGQPMPGARVRAMRPTIRENQRALQTVREVIANDLGEYRLSGLIPGRYYISAAVVDIPASGVAALVLSPDAPAGDQGASRSTPRPVTSRPPGNGLAEDEIFAPIFHPATSDSRDALPVDLDPGVEYRAADIYVYPINTYHVRGVVANMALLPGAQTNAAGGARGAAPAAPAQAAPQGRGGAGGAGNIRLAPLDPNGATYNTAVDPMTGAFDFTKIAPGNYVAYMFVSGLTVRAARPVEVLSGDVNGVFLDVTPGVDIPVRVTFDGEPPQGLPDVASLNVTLWRDPTLMQAPSIPMTRGESPAIRNLAMGDYRLYAPPLLQPLQGTEPLVRNNWPNAYIKSIRLGDEDVLNGGLHVDPSKESVVKLITQAQEAAAAASGNGAEKPPELALEVVVGANPGAVTGRVVNENQEPVPSVTVTLYAESLSSRIVRSDMYKVTSTDVNGRFQVQGLPPGDYKIFAWDAVERGAWLDPVFTMPFESAGKSVRVEEGKIETVELSPIRAK